MVKILRINCRSRNDKVTEKETVKDAKNINKLQTSIVSFQNVLELKTKYSMPKFKKNCMQKIKTL